MRLVGLILLIIIYGMLLPGCQDHGTAPTGMATVRIAWPAPSKLIPEATARLHVTIRRGETVLAEGTAVRPPETTTSTINFPTLPVETLTITAEALAAPETGSAPLASGTKPLTVAANTVTEVRLTLTPTITRLVIDPPAPTLTVGEHLTLTAHAYDAEDNWVLVTPKTLHWSASFTAATVDATTGELTAVEPGSASVTVADDESKAWAHATVLVTAAAGQPEQLVCCSDRDGNGELYRLDVDGSNLTRLTNTPGEELFPAIAPNGSEIAYAYVTTSNEAISSVIKTLAQDGGMRMLTDGPADTMPAWSRSGRKIAYIADNYTCLKVIDVVTSLVDTIPIDPSLTRLQYPRWSPDGNTILFVAQTAGEVQNLYQIQLDGEGFTRLTSNTQKCYITGASWSSTGLIVYSFFDRVAIKYGMYTLDPDTNLTTTLSTEPMDRAPCWSPDGTRLLISGTPTPPQYDLLILNGDGSRQRLTFGPTSFTLPAWGIAP